MVLTLSRQFVTLTGTGKAVRVFLIFRFISPKTAFSYAAVINVLHPNSQVQNLSSLHTASVPSGTSQCGTDVIITLGD